MFHFKQTSTKLKLLGWNERLAADLIQLSVDISGPNFVSCVWATLDRNMYTKLGLVAAEENVQTTLSTWVRQLLEKNYYSECLAARKKR